MAAETELTGSQQKPHLFQPGQSGNPAGRPRGARSKLGEDFLKALVADFNEEAEDGKTNGIIAIRKMRTDNPDQYVRVIAAVLPKEIELSGEVALLSKEQRDAAVAAASRADQ